MRAARCAGLLLVIMLAACSSTQRPVAELAPPPRLPTVTPERPTAVQPSATPTSPAPTATTPAAELEATQTPNDAPVSASMREIGIGGERYAALGDPNAPLTMIEFSDYG
jgi:uncharacterized lipoprotein